MHQRIPEEIAKISDSFRRLWATSRVHVTDSSSEQKINIFVFQIWNFYRFSGRERERE